MLCSEPQLGAFMQLSCFHYSPLHDCWLNSLSQTDIYFNWSLRGIQLWGRSKFPLLLETDRLITFTTVYQFCTLKSLPNLREGVRSVFFVIRFNASREVQFLFSGLFPHEVSDNLHCSRRWYLFTRLYSI